MVHSMSCFICKQHATSHIKRHTPCSYCNHPSIKPVNPKEIGALPKQAARAPPVTDDTKDIADSQTTLLAAAADETVAPSRTATVASQEEAAAPQTAAAAPAAPAVPAGKPVGTAGPQGKPAAAFKMKPSKEVKKMDLGEAYLLAQTQKTATLAVQHAAKCRADMSVSLAGAGKSPDDIRLLLVLLNPE